MENTRPPEYQREILQPEILGVQRTSSRSTRRGVKNVVLASMLSAVVATSSTLGVLHFMDPTASASAAGSTGIGSTPMASTVATGGDALSISEIIAKVEPAVVTINTSTTVSSRSRGFGMPQQPSQTSEGTGTGMVIDSSGIVLTNAHVVSGASNIAVTIPGDSQTHTATVLGIDTQADVAMLKIADVSNLKTVTLASADPAVGDNVVAIGNALGLEGEPTVTSGIISALNRSISDDTAQLSGLLQTDAAINPGNSGGPLVNAAGEVIGMNTAVSSEAQNIGFAIDINNIRALIDQLENGGSSNNDNTQTQLRNNTSASLQS